MMEPRLSRQAARVVAEMNATDAHPRKVERFRKAVAKARSVSDLPAWAQSLMRKVENR